ncbi:phage tail spike protein [Bacillus toyonensis]|uniref:phage tail protein n=1 Tax=Bacillus toyonensis TaxID=155322 RepID=UPI003D23374A
MNLITITDVLGNTEILTGFKSFNRVRKVNGEKVISFLIIPTEENKYAFPLVQEESKVEFDGETYIIKSIAERNIGNTFYKQVECIHDFFVKMIDKQKYEVHDGSMTLRDALDFVFEGTGYQTAIIDSFYAQDFENFGKDNRLSLLKKVLERYRAEMSISGNLVRFKTKIGEDTDFQFRYNFNIKTFERTIDTKSLATYIRGYGKDGLMREYTSPNVHIFGFLEAPMIEDERYTTISGLDNALKESLQDTPVISMTLDFIDLRKAGYPYIIPNEGDRVLLIYEPMNVDIETRIMEIDEEFNNELEIISCKVTLANYKKDLSGTLLQAIQKSLKGIVNNDGKIIYNALDEAVKRATQAIKNAQTELVFENGILAVDPNNPNNLVAFNSAGIGVSRDGGNTFKEALTYEGLVASVGVVGQFEANNIRVGPETTFHPGYSPVDVRTDLRLTAPLPTTINMDMNGITSKTSQSDSFARLDYRGLYVKKGAIQIERPDGYNLIIDGTANFDMGVSSHEPPFMSPGVEVNAYWYSTRNTTWSNCNYFTFKHTGRYLVFALSLAVDAGSEAQVKIRDIYGTDLWYTKHSKTIADDYYINATIDLGVPTGQMRYVYLMIASNSANHTAYARVLSKWSER